MQKTVFILGLCVYLVSACTKDGSSVAPSGSGSGVGGSLARFTIAKEYLYVVEDYTIKVFDLRNPTLPVYKNTINRSANTILETVFSYKDNLFVGGTDGMFIYNIANPDNPILLGSAVHLRSCDPVVSNDSASYVTLRSGTNCGTAIPGLYVYDVRNLNMPSQMAYINLPAPYGLSLHDTTLYVCLADSGLQVLNVRQLFNPMKVKRISGESFTDVICYDNLMVAWVKSGISIYNISQRENPVKIGFVKN